MVVETYSHVLHIVSSVSGTLRDGRVGHGRAARLAAGRHAVAARRRSARCRSSTSSSPSSAGPYGGSVGYLSYTGDLDTCIYIRSAVVKDGRVHVQAGGGIVADSEAGYEVRETEAQGRRGVRRDRAGLRAGGLGMKVLVIDNYDSFTFNLVQYLGELGAEPDVVRNDVATVDELLERGAERLIVSPGPCTPAEAGVSTEAIRSVRRGRHARCWASASATRRWPRPSAGGWCAASPCTARRRRWSTTAARSSTGLPSPLTAGRYHSLIVDPDLPETLEASAHSRRHGDGHPPPRAARGGRAVPPRVGAHGRGLAAAGKLLGTMRRGLILLVFATALAGAPEAAAAGKCGGSYRYALTVTGVKSVSETWQPGQFKAGEFGLSYRYKVSYPRARVRVHGCRGGRTLTGSLGRGTGRISYSWFDRTREVASGTPPPCSFSTTLRGLRAKGTLTGDVAPGNGGRLDHGVGADQPGASRLERALEARRAAVCTEFNETGLHELPVFGAVFPKGFRVPSGVLTDPRLSLPGSVRIDRLTGRAPALIRRLAAGRAASLSKSATGGGAITEVRAVARRRSRSASAAGEARTRPRVARLRGGRSAQAACGRHGHG